MSIYLKIAFEIKVYDIFLIAETDIACFVYVCMCAWNLVCMPMSHANDTILICYAVYAILFIYNVVCPQNVSTESVLCY